MVLKTFCFFVAAVVAPAVVQAATAELEFKEGSSSVAIEYTAAGGLLVPGYAKKDDVTQLAVALEATLKTYTDDAIATVSTEIAALTARVTANEAKDVALATSIDTIALTPGPAGVGGPAGPAGSSGVTGPISCSSSTSSYEHACICEGRNACGDGSRCISSSTTTSCHV
jgi:hypothetical protein